MSAPVSTTQDSTAAQTGAKIQIKSRFTGAVLFGCELPAEVASQSRGKQLGYAIKEAIKARAYLADANLAGADLAGADLAGADLAGADLAGAYLAGADLAGAYLAGADLADANLADANLADAYLADAYLADADLAGADLAGADLAGADLAGAKNVPETNGSESVRTPEQLKEYERARAERFRARFPEVPVVDQLDAKILAAIDAGGTLNMSSWHKCETTHCRAGWAITLAGQAGAELESKYGPEDAGRRIYLASTGRVPNFFADDATALEDIKHCASEAT